MDNKPPRESPIIDLKVYKNRISLHAKKPSANQMRKFGIVILAMLIILLALVYPETRSLAEQIILAILETLFGALFAGARR